LKNYYRKKYFSAILAEFNILDEIRKIMDIKKFHQMRNTHSAGFNMCKQEESNLVTQNYYWNMIQNSA
jgi:hypothetical protein